MLAAIRSARRLIARTRGDRCQPPIKAVGQQALIACELPIRPVCFASAAYDLAEKRVIAGNRPGIRSARNLMPWAAPLCAASRPW